MRLSLVNKAVNKLIIEQLKQDFKIKLEQAPVILKQLAEKNKKGFFNKLTDLNQWYTKIIGLHEVKLSQDKVTELQELLWATQEQRREFGKQLAEVRDKSNELQEQLHKVKRQENLELFLTLMKEETEIIKLEKEIHKTFQQYDQKEREIFTAFANAIRDSHEKQRAQLEYTKYFGVVLSIIGSSLAFFYSTLKKHDLKFFIESNVNTLVNNSNDLKLFLQNVEENIKYSNSLKTMNVLTPAPAAEKSLRDDYTQTFYEANIIKENTVIRYALYGVLGLLILRAFTG